MRIALLQLNPTLGDIERNVRDIGRAYGEAVGAGAELVVAGELAVCGYPPEDLVLKRGFVHANGRAVEELAAQTGTVPLVAGFVEDLIGVPRAAWQPVASEATAYPPLANAAAVLREGAVEVVGRKQRLPNYGVFDEARYFMAGTSTAVVDVAGTAVGITICEDIWGEGGPVELSADQGAALIVNLNASPYHRGKRAERELWARHHAERWGVWLAYANQVGGQDEIVFDGDSFVVAPSGDIVARGAQFRPDTVIVDLDLGEGTARQIAGDGGERLDPVGEVYSALVLGTRDYARKNGFSTGVLGISGGIDSALTATVAVDALGADAVTGVAMPSPYSSPGSLVDAKTLAGNLGMGYLELEILAVMEAFDRTLAEPFAGTEPDVAEENIQSRIRGTLLMALSNKFGHLVLATGNKSEYAVGYSTLYGDMAGGFAVIKDVPKLLVYELARWRNEVAGGELVPASTMAKPPSAELRPDQLDTDSLPPYDVLDPILEAYVEQDRAVSEIVASGYEADVVRRIVALVDRAEYKRRQAAPGVKITRRAFGKDRRLPITQSWAPGGSG